jgi:hypothetical protein
MALVRLSSLTSRRKAWPAPARPNPRFYSGRVSLTGFRISGRNLDAIRRAVRNSDQSFYFALDSKDEGRGMNDEAGTWNAWSLINDSANG